MRFSNITCEHSLSNHYSAYNYVHSPIPKKQQKIAFCGILLILPPFLVCCYALLVHFTLNGKTLSNEY